MATKKKMLQAAAGVGGDVGAWDLSYAYYDDPNGWDLSSANYSNKSFNVSATGQAPFDLFFKPDGTKMYILAYDGDDVNEYDLSTAWDVTTATYVQTFSIAAQDIYPFGLFFKPDGTKMYFVGDQNDSIYEYDLSTAWDVSTASYSQTTALGARPSGLFFHPDGTKMYHSDLVANTIREYDLSTAWDTSTITFLQSFSISAQDGTPYGVAFKPDGTKMYFVGGDGDDINEYDLSTAWDISSASFVQNFSVASQETNPYGLFFKPNGVQFYLVGSTTDTVFQYTLGGFNVGAEEQTIEGIFFKPDGTKLYICGTAGDEVNEYDLSTAWDLSTASFSQALNVYSQTRDPASLFFKPDGTVMYVASQALSKVILQYNLSTAWDISTAVFTTSIGVGIEVDSPTGVFFKDDGTKMYVLGNSGDDVNEYDLSTAWRVDTATYSQNFSVAVLDTSPQEVFFKDDGTKMYILCDTNNKFYEYELSTAWDVSTASYTQDFFINNVGGFLRGGLFFKDDGTRMYLADFQTDSIYSYTLGVQE